MAVAGSVEIDLIAKVAKLESDLNQATRHLTRFEGNTTKSLAKVRDFAMASNGSMEKLIKFTPQMMAFAATAGGVWVTLKGIYDRNANLQASAGKLGEAWDRLVVSIGNVLPLEKAGKMIEWVADKVTTLANKINGTGQNGTQQAMSDKEWEDIKARAEANYKVYEEEKKQAQQLADKKAALLLKQQDDRKKAMDAAAGDYEKVWESTLDAEQSLALKYNKDSNEAIAYLKLFPEEKDKVTKTLLALEEKYQADLKAIKDKGEADEEARRQREVASQIEAQKRMTDGAQWAADQYMSLDEQRVNASINLMHALGKKSKAFAIAAFIAEKAIAIQRVLVQTQVAAAAALTPPPIGLGPVAGQALAARIISAGYTSAALIGASSIVEAVNNFGSSNGTSTTTTTGSGASSTSPSSSGNQSVQPNTIMVQIVGNIYSVTDFRKAVADALKDATNADMIVISGDDGQRMSVA